MTATRTRITTTKATPKATAIIKSPFVTHCELWIEFGRKNTKRQRNGCLTGGKMCIKSGKIQKMPVSSSIFHLSL